MKTKHRRWQLTVFSSLLVLCVLLVAQEAINTDQAGNITRGGSDTTSQTLTLVSGWNWVGFNVLPASRKVGDALGTTGFTVNDLIQTNGDSARFTGTSWTPESFTIEYGKLYQVYVTKPVTVSVNGVADGPSSLPLVAGWNWIANSTLEDVTLSQLTHSGSWTENDRIQTGGGHSAVYINGRWIPSGFMLEAGKSYQVFAGNTGTLAFPTVNEENALYAVVDLSGGPDATSYLVRYTNTAPDLDDDTCRTTELWLRKIPTGTFIMGSPEDEVGRWNGYDMAQHEVTLTQDFYIGVFECTQKQWELVMGSNPSFYKGDCRPVERVSYNMIRGTSAQAGAGWPSYGHEVDNTSFMGRLQKKTGLVFDLPTEAQWEYACRAGTTSALNSGENLTNTTSADANMDKVGRYYNNQSDGKGGYLEHTKVGSYLPNAWGIYDMHGNVWEWCLDWGEASTSSTEVETDPTGSDTGWFRVVRSGGWNNDAGSCRSACRSSSYPSNDDGKSIGFRVHYLPRHDLYAVVDLSGGPNAASYPVRYSSVGPNQDDDTCRTTELWLRRIPAGTFTMGSPEDELGRLDGYDMTQHEVILTQDFYLGVFECTQKQWELVMGSKPSYFNNAAYYATRPVEQVSYNMIRGTGEQAGAGWPTYGHNVDSTSFMGKLQMKTGLVFDLPTEAQWEYACRAGTTTALNSGKNLTSAPQDANMDKVGRYGYNGGSSYSQSCDLVNGTMKVGSYLPNAWGLYDMHGNVYEWCLDWYGASTSSTVAETDPVGPDTGPHRVLHGGSWNYGAHYCRSAYRGHSYPSSVYFGNGFRVLCLPKRNLYAVVDLSDGPDAVSYPIRYTDTAPNLNDDTCRTTELWLRRIPKGTFIMGSPEDEVGRLSSDMAQHAVTITKDFYIGVFECTQKQWELVMGTKPSYFNNATYYATRPVEQVSFNMIRGTDTQGEAGWPTYGNAVDSSSFMGKLQKKTGLTFDLPTEAQWEYACRAGTTTALNSGKNLTNATSADENMDEVGRYRSNGGSGNSQNCTPINGTAKVGSYLPNAWGLYDMHGNVNECCLDWWEASTSSTSAETDPVGPFWGSYRVRRGGQWNYYANYCRSAYRDIYSPTDGYNNVSGFRVLCLP